MRGPLLNIFVFDCLFPGTLQGRNCGWKTEEITNSSRIKARVGRAVLSKIDFLGSSNLNSWSVKLDSWTRNPLSGSSNPLNRSSNPLNGSKKRALNWSEHSTCHSTTTIVVGNSWATQSPSIRFKQVLFSLKYPSQTSHYRTNSTPPTCFMIVFSLLSLTVASLAQCLTTNSISLELSWVRINTDFLQ
jgi:hypothetical protein